MTTFVRHVNEACAWLVVKSEDSTRVLGVEDKILFTRLMLHYGSLGFSTENWDSFQLLIADVEKGKFRIFRIKRLADGIYRRSLT